MEKTTYYRLNLKQDKNKLICSDRPINVILFRCLSAMGIPWAEQSEEIWKQRPRSCECSASYLGRLTDPLQKKNSDQTLFRFHFWNRQLNCFKVPNSLIKGISSSRLSTQVRRVNLPRATVSFPLLAAVIRCSTFTHSRTTGHATDEVQLSAVIAAMLVSPRPKCLRGISLKVHNMSHPCHQISICIG